MNLKKLLQVLRICDVIGYSFLLLFALHNTVAFLILQGKARMYLITVFYVLTVTIAVSRIIDQLVWGINLKEHPNDDQPPPPTIWYFDKVAFYAKAELGLFQITSMAQLILLVKFSAKLITSKSYTLKMKRLFWATWIIALTYACVGIYDSRNDKFVIDDNLEDARFSEWSYTWLSACVLFSVSTGLIVSISILFYILKHHH